MLFLMSALSLSGPALGEQIAVVSDLNGAYGSTEYSDSVRNAVQALIKNNIPLVLVTGDMVAGQKAGLNYKAMWSSFHKEFTTPLRSANVKVAISPGNHDASRGFEEERVEYSKQWSQRDLGLEFVERSQFPFYYSFHFENTLFIALDATSVGPLPAAQREWLRQQLHYNSFKFERTVVFGHMPMWPVVSDAKGLEILNDVKLDNLLKDYGVWGYLSGHTHAFFPAVWEGMRYLSQGLLGSGTRTYRNTSIVSFQSLTLIDLDSGVIQGRRGNLLNQPVLPSQLPSKIQWGNVTLALDPSFIP